MNENEVNKIDKDEDVYLQLKEYRKKKDLVEDIVTKVLSGEVNVAKAFVAIKRMKEVSEEALKDERLKPVFIEAIERELDGKKAHILGTEVSVATVYTSYDFKDCNHIRLNALYDLVENCKKEIKVIEDELKLMISDSGAFGLKVKEISIPSLPEISEDESLGEVVTLRPPIKYQTTGLKVSEL